ncbi:MAG: aspartate 1-decarboxylase [Alphaproteobacteria bacterium]|nr:aspartate 1-decarboxylase [Alphaproteobacteria bacterium]
MILTVLKAKIHRATVTCSDLHYEGSITIDRDLMDRAGLLTYEQVDVLNINNGARFTTYVIEGTRGGQDFCVNGAAARLVQPGDRIIVCAFCQMDETMARAHQPVVLLMDEDNRPK